MVGNLYLNSLNRCWKKHLAIGGIVCFAIAATADAQPPSRRDSAVISPQVHSHTVTDTSPGQYIAFIVSARRLRLNSLLSSSTPKRGTGHFCRWRYTTALRWHHSRRAARVHASTLRGPAQSALRPVNGPARFPIAYTTYCQSPRAPPSL